MATDRHRVYDRDAEHTLLIKEFESFVVVEIPRRGALSSRTCDRADGGAPTVPEDYPGYVTRGLELAGIDYRVD